MSDYIKPVAAILLPFSGGMISASVTKGEVRPAKGTNTWYQALNKPKLNPPSWVFPPVWSALYGTMGYASYMVYRDGDGFGGKACIPLALYGTQLALNWAWSPIFFKYHKLGLATIELGAVWAATAATMATFYEINPNATYLLAPYLAWLSFAGYLSFSIWRNNKDRTD